MHLNEKKSKERKIAYSYRLKVKPGKSEQSVRNEERTPEKTSFIRTAPMM